MLRIMKKKILNHHSRKEKENEKSNRQKDYIIRRNEHIYFGINLKILLLKIWSKY